MRVVVAFVPNDSIVELACPLLDDGWRAVPTRRFTCYAKVNRRRHVAGLSSLRFNSSAEEKRIMVLEKLLSSGRKIRVIGFDDAHYEDKTLGSEVHIAGIVCSDTRFEGMLWNSIQKDGNDATDGLGNMLAVSKFAAQVQVVLTDGITFGGCNVVDINELHERLKVPVIAVMRRHPDLDAFRFVVDRLPDPETRWAKVQAAGPIHELNDFVFQVIGETPLVASKVSQAIDGSRQNAGSIAAGAFDRVGSQIGNQWKTSVRSWFVA